MTLPNLLLNGCSVGLLFGCATQTVVLSPVGPPPLARASGESGAALVVFSAEDFGAPGDEPYHYYSGYLLFSGSGKKLKYVANRAGNRGQDPSRLSLPPGRYKIHARAAAFGYVMVPVVLEAGKTT